MESARMDIFFSCSFKQEDEAINKFFQSICSALDIKCINVDGAFREVPPEAAKKLINESQGLIAIATKRDLLASGEFAMPAAVHEEISIAFGKDTPMLIFVEEGVKMDGMKTSFGTYQSFSREDLYSSTNLEKTIKAIHRLKLEVISPNDINYTPESTEMVADHYQQLVELRREADDYKWIYSSNKRISFLDAYKGHIPIAFWATVPAHVAPDEPNIHAEIILESHSRDLSLKIETVKETPDCSRSLVKVEPHPEKGDYIEYSTHVESKYFNPIFSQDIIEDKSIEYKGKRYQCIDGLIPIQRTKIAVLEFRFPRGFTLKKDDITFIVGSYTDEIDFIVESEIKRAVIEYREIGGNLTARMEIESPLPRHMYAFAWNPPKRIAIL